VYAGVNNVIDRPIYLPTLDLANGKTIDPTRDTTVTTAALPGVSLSIKAGSLLDQQGTPFTGVLSITQVPSSRTPAALPANVDPDLVVTIQPGQMVFATPAPMTFPNRAGWAPGTRMDLYSINPVTGQFDDVGDMQVSPDGQTIETISGGVRNSSWHFARPPQPEPEPPGSLPENPDNSCNECPSSAGGNSNVELHSGAEIESHSLVPYMSQGVDHSWTLTYDSLRADPRPIVHFGYQNTQPFTNLTLVGSLSITRGNFTYDVPGFQGGSYGLDAGDHIWAVSPDEPDAEVALQADLRNAPSGRYQANIRMALKQFDGSNFFGTSSEDTLDIIHVNTIDSPFGSGWGMDGLQELVENPDGSVLLVDGDGGETLYQPPAAAGQPYRSPPGTFSTLVRQSDQTFRLTTTDGTVYQFNLQNKLASQTDRNGNATTFAYDAQGRLQTITDPVGLKTTLTIGANGRVSQITDPAGRVTKLEYDAAGNLTRVVDPDGTARTWTYDAEHHMIGEIDQRGSEEHTVYDFAGRVQQAVLKDGTVRQFQPLQVQNLLPPEATIDPLAPPFAGSRHDSARFADEKGNVQVVKLDRAGQMVSAYDASGQLPSVVRDNQNQITSDIDARGHLKLYEYDSRGNLTSERDENSGGGSIIGAIATPGARSVYTFTGKVGQKIFYQGLSSAPDDLRVQLLSPSGDSLYFNHDEASGGVFTLDQDGKYQLEFSGNGNATGDYHFRLIEPKVSVAPLTIGSDVTGTIDVPGDLDVFTFDATPGQKIVYDGLASANDDLRVQLVSPTGRQIFFDHDEANEGPFTLDEAGTYRFNLFGNGDAVGDYHFRVVQPTVTVAPLTFGSDVTGTIDSPGDLDVYTFDATPGQRIFYDGLDSANDDLRALLISPTGRQIFFDHDEANEGPYTLDEAGTYRLNLFGNNDAVGDYHFRVVQPTVTVASLTLGSDVTGTIDLPGDLDVYTFNATPGQKIFYDGLTSANDDLRALLTSPTGRQIFFDHDEANEGPYTLDEAGTYRLNLFGNSDAVGDYHFRVVQPTVTVAPLTLGSDVTGTIDLPGDLDVYTFNAVAGQSVYYDGLASANDDLRALLTSPTGRQIFFNHDEANEGPYTLDEAGTYRLNLFGSSDAVGDYHFRLFDLAAQTLATGVPVSGSLASGAATAAYQIAGSRGQRLTFDSLQSGNASWSVRGPAGQLISSDLGIGTDFTVTLPSDGPYTLFITGNGAASAVPFSFQVNDVTDPTVAPSGLGQVRSGTIAAGQIATFTFNVPAGLTLYFDVQGATSAASLRAELRDPDNAQLFFTDDMTDRGPLTPLRSGAYTLTIQGDTAASTGGYQFALLDLASGGAALTAGDTVTGDLAPQEVKVFSWNASIGDRFLYDGLESDFDNVTATLYSPSGARIFNNNADENVGPLTLTESGTYQLLVSNNTVDTRDYKFRVLKPTFGAQPLTIGATVSDQLAGPGDEKQYTFTGAVGQRIFYDSLQNDFAIPTRERLVSPSGIVLWNDNTDANTGPLTLTEAGTYHLRITADGDAAGTYSFRIVSPSLTSQPLTIGSTVTDQLAGPGDEKQYTFTGAVGQRIFYDSLQNDFAIPTRERLVSPSGIVLWNDNTDANAGPLTLTEAGTYHLRITADNDASGTYSFRILQPTFSSQPLNFGSPVIDQLAAPGDEKRYTFSGSVGERIFYDSLQNDFAVDTRKILVAPSGAIFWNQNTDDNAGPLTLTEAGTYQLRIFGGNDAAGPYAFQVLSFDTASPIEFDSTQTGTIAKGLGTKLFRFVGEAGQRLMFDALQSANLGWSLFGSSNTAIAGRGSFDDFTVTLPAAGTYWLELHNNTATDNAAYQFRIVTPDTTVLPLTLGAV
ncbi:MAG: hypothetical protein ACTHK7_23565, partial [Aureliella sp.]